MILLELLPDKPFVVVPSTAEAGVEAPFEIRCECPSDLKVLVLLLRCVSAAPSLILTATAAGRYSMLQGMVLMSCIWALE
jgi:hypothetical protein